MMGGKEAASPRYIFTNLTTLARLVFHKDDDNILSYQVEEGQRIEPDFYAPILPMCLINGAEGIGTGWSTSIPCYNPLQIADNIRKRLRNRNYSFHRMIPWFRGFTGRIELKEDGTNYIVHGRFARVDREEKLIISELPIQVWTRNYKNFLEELAQNDKIADIKELHKDNTVHFVLTITDLKKLSDEEIMKDFRLTTSMSCSNFVLFDRDYKIRRYANEIEILEEFF
jgi:DNA topoisomerase-2